MELLTPSLGFLFWVLLAFVIVFVILKKYAWGPILSSLKERENNIADSIATAENVKMEMVQLKNDNELLLAKAREERALLLKEAKETADKMVIEAKDKAKTEYERIITDAQVAIQQQKNAALTDVKNQVGKLVIEVAEKVLRKELSNKSEQEQFVRQMAEEAKL